MHKFSCLTCARRKVKCDKNEPCSQCLKGDRKCVFQAPAPSLRHRKRPFDDYLVEKVHEYERLLQKHKISFEPLDTSLSRPDSSHHDEAEPEEPPESSDVPPPPSLVSDTERKPTCSWAALPVELREPAFERLQSQIPPIENENGTINKELAAEALPLLPSFPSPFTDLRSLHPNPEHVLKLWQIFAEKIHPLTKVIHAPTLQQRILEVAWNLDKLTPSLEAVMFGVYTLAVSCMRPSDSLREFGEPGSVLLSRYRSASAQALTAANLCSTKDFEVLQAFMLYLILEPRSEETGTAIAFALRIGHKMGLHRTGIDPKMSIFEQEMRLRVWWLLTGMDSRVRRRMLGLTHPFKEYGNVPLPLNVNDAELDPHMSIRPNAESSRATDMMFPMLLFEVMHYARTTLLKSSKGASPYELMASKDPGARADKWRVVSDLETIYEEKYLRHCDDSIPLHRITKLAAQLTIRCEQFRVLHPHHQPDEGRYMSQADLDKLFEISIRLIDINLRPHETIFSAAFLEHLLGLKVEPLVFLVSELRFRNSGPLVEEAWSLLEEIYKRYPQLVLQQDKFCMALARLILEAWDSRNEQNPHLTWPEFITTLAAGRHDAPITDGISLDLALQFQTMQDDPLLWTLWNEFPNV